MLLRDLRKFMNQEKSQDISIGQRDLLLLLMKYYSPHCKFTHDPKAVPDIIRKFKIGMMNEYNLQLEVQKVKDMYEQLRKEDFADKYDDSYVNIPNPAQNRGKYMMTRDQKELLQFTDNVIFYKKKMVELGKREEERPRVYINKLYTGLQDGGRQRDNSINYQNTIFYQRQPTLCDVAKAASQVLLKVYDADSRYIVDEKDYERVRFDNNNTSKKCGDHGLGADLLVDMKKESEQMINKFYDDLVDPKKKIPVEVQMSRLVDYIRKSSEPELVNLRKILKDQSEDRDMKYEELRELNPLILLKREPEDPSPYSEHQLKELTQKIQR